MQTFVDVRCRRTASETLQTDLVDFHLTVELAFTFAVHAENMPKTPKNSFLLEEIFSGLSGFNAVFVRHVQDSLLSVCFVVFLSLRYF